VGKYGKHSHRKDPRHGSSMKQPNTYRSRGTIQTVAARAEGSKRSQRKHWTVEGKPLPTATDALRLTGSNWTGKRCLNAIIMNERRDGCCIRRAPSKKVFEFPRYHTSAGKVGAVCWRSRFGPQQFQVRTWQINMRPWWTRS
jgi:hypothetical protein